MKKAEKEDKQQVKDYLPTYIKKLEEESDEPKSTIKDLEKEILDKAEPKKNVMVGVLLSKKKKTRNN